MSKLKSYIHQEVVIYLFFGVLATCVYTLARLGLFAVFQQATLSAVLANAIAILFAFFTNDKYVFKQEKVGWQKRLIKFVGARFFTLVLDLVLAYILVEKFPQIIGVFVHHQPTLINLVETLLAQVLIIVLNYIISKWLVFK